MRALAWLILLYVALTMAMPDNPRMTQNSQRTARTEEQKDDEDGNPLSPLRLGEGKRMLSSQKTCLLKSTVKPVPGSGDSKIYDVKHGRPIWRTIRESVFTTLNQVGGGLGDYMSQASIEGGTPLKVIDGYGGLLGYDLELIDTASGPIRERVYEIIRANLEPGSLLLDSLRQINAVKDMPLYEWVIEMDAIYFDINPEMGLQAQQDFQTLVYEHLYTIISFLILFQQYANDYEFFQQFLNNDGVPFRMQASVSPATATHCCHCQVRAFHRMFSTVRRGYG